MYVDLNTIGLIWPEVILIVIATWIYVAGTLGDRRQPWYLLAVTTYAVAAWVLLRNEARFAVALEAGVSHGSGPLIVDYLGQLVRLACLPLGMLLTLLVNPPEDRTLESERVATVMVMVAGLMLVSRANDLVFLFVGLELVSIPTYVLLFLGRRGRATGEATAKYFFLSVLASAMLLYGMSFLYGVAGGTTVIAGNPLVEGIREAVARLTPGQAGLYLIGLILVMAGLGFKIAAVPFHFYAPDVYQGTTNALAGLLAVVPKIAGGLAVVRLVAGVLPGNVDVGWRLVVVLSVVTMTLGNTCALWQQNLRRLLAFSAIAHSGYLLIGLAVAMAAPQFGGIAAMLFYLLVYALASLGAFGVLALLSSGRHELSEVRELAGLARARPWVAAALAICLFSLAGIPPLAGFWGKLTLLAGAVRIALDGAGDTSTWFLVLAVVAGLNAAAAAAYYLRVIATMYFQPAIATSRVDGAPRVLIAMAACVLGVVTVGLLPGAVLSRAESADPGLRPVVHGQQVP